MKSTSVRRRPSIATTVLWTFVILKLTGQLNWSWWWITSPAWIVLGLWVCVCPSIWGIIRNQPRGYEAVPAGASLSVCAGILQHYTKEQVMIAAMTRDEYKSELRKGICEITFTKKDGTERVMRCTLAQAHMPVREYEKDAHGAEEPTQGQHQHSCGFGIWTRRRGEHSTWTA
jgi:hypothetical protein